MSAPRVTAIVTVFNGEDFVAHAVESLLAQTLHDIEILIVNDGSTDGTFAILDALSDPRLRIIHLPRSGRAAALAMACREARGRYIANLDADDISYPERLERQAAFLDAHPDHAWVGCGEEQEDSRRGEHHRRIYPLSDMEIRRQSAKCIPYCHSGAMFRRSLIDEGINYDPAQPYLIDFEFFLRVAERHKVANLPEVLVKRYVRGESFFQSRYKTWRQNLRLARLCARAVRRFGLPVRFYLYPLARLIYPYIPHGLKRRIRQRHGLEETDA
ncbi:glycosyl transferase family 2 [Sulfuritortus calidifontis]|uniref:Glycosyl transferase family 2 n=1 Tax=Sulfuritortus calidifontis TaxID=1914471 RepID=A0A4R3JVD3_9PROT|nr:glycosyltransferase family 2 protein [Sulfuritortus calidifontis]TCS71935.1 glycosyl transferase family 2 [Sulfuritortus calidifontis]